jgi:glycosyltransferase involved in cell wall biosynthesis
MVISIVIPLYNESEGIDIFHHDHLIPSVKNALQSSYEILYVNDGSNDNTLSKLTLIAKKDKHVRVINLSRNFGKEVAITAGIYTAIGDAVIIMDGDGQHPPEKIKNFIDEWHKGAQVVIGIRSTNGREGLLKKWGSKIFYKLFNATSGNAIIPNSTDFRLIDKVVQREFLKFSERNRITRGLIDWLGFERAYVTFDSPARLAGEASYKFRQLVRLALNSFVSLSLRPLFIFGWVGMVITLFSFIIGTFIFIEQLLLNDPLSFRFTGSALLGIFISFLVGIVLTSQGIMAIYLSHVHGQTQARPLFIINTSSSYNLIDDEDK